MVFAAVECLLGLCRSNILVFAASSGSDTLKRLSDNFWKRETLRILSWQFLEHGLKDTIGNAFNMTVKLEVLRLEFCSNAVSAEPFALRRTMLRWIKADVVKRTSAPITA